MARMIQREAWYREALEKELDQALQGPPTPESYEALKKLYLRTGALPGDVGEMVYNMAIEKVDSGSYDVLDLAVVWKGTPKASFPEIPLRAVMDTPEEYLPVMDFHTVLRETSYDFSDLPPEAVREAADIWLNSSEDQRPLESIGDGRVREALHRIDRSPPISKESQEKLSLKQVLQRMGPKEGWTIWSPLGSGAYVRAPSGQPAIHRWGYWEQYLEEHAGESNVPSVTEYVDVGFSERDIADKIMDVLIPRGPGRYRMLKEWLKEMGATY